MKPYFTVGMKVQVVDPAPYTLDRYHTAKGRITVDQGIVLGKRLFEIKLYNKTLSESHGYRPSNVILPADQLNHDGCIVGDVLTIPEKGGLWVVEEAGWSGGGTGHGPHDVYPDGLHVTARRLTHSFQYDLPQESIKFVWGPAPYNTAIEGCIVVVRMTRVVDFINLRMEA